LYMPMELILNKKSYMPFSCVFDLKKKSVLKLLDLTVYISKTLVFLTSLWFILRTFKWLKMYSVEL
jgi:hypothetical protein